MRDSALIPTMMSRQATASQAWHSLSINYWGLSPDLSAEVWLALQRADAARSLLFAWNRMMRTVGDTAQIVALLEGHLKPRNFCELLEVLVDEGHLSRRAVSDVEELLLARTDKHGRWLENPP